MYKNRLFLRAKKKISKLIYADYTIKDVTQDSIVYTCDFTIKRKQWKHDNEEEN